MAKKKSPILRRLSLRLGLYGLLCLGGLGLFYHSELFKTLALHHLNRYLLEEQSIQLLVREWDFSLWHGYVRGRDLVVVSRGGSLWGRVPSFDLKFSLNELWTRRLEPQSIKLDGVELRLFLPAADLRRPEKAADSEVKVRLRRLQVTGGRVWLNELEIPLEFATDDFNFTFSQPVAEGRCLLDLALGGLALGSGERQAAIDRIEASGIWENERLMVSRFRIESKPLAWQGSGSLAMGDELTYEVAGHGRVDLARLAPFWGTLPVSLAGEVKFGVNAAGHGQVLDRLAGEISAPKLVVNKLNLHGLAGKITSAPDGFSLDHFHLGLDRGGSIQGRWEIDPALNRLAFAGAIRGLDLGLLSEGELVKRPVDGLAEGSLKVEIPFRGGAPLVEWDGQIASFTVLLPKGDETYRGEFVRGRVRLDGTGIHFTGVQAFGEGLLVEADGRVAGSELWLDRLHLLAPAQEEARDLVSRLAKLSPKLTEKLGQVEIDGKTEFNGKLHLAGSFPEIEGALEITGVTIGSYSWDRILVPVQLDRNAIHIRQGRLEDGRTRVGLDLDLKLEPETSVAMLDLDVTAFEYRRLERFLYFLDLDLGQTRPSEYVNGYLSGRLTLEAFDGPSPTGGWDLAIHPLQVWSEDVGGLTVKGGLAQNRLTLEQVRLRGPDLLVEAAGALNLADERIQLKADIRELRLEKLPARLQAGLNGAVRGSATFSGPLLDPTIEMEFRSDKLLFYGEPFGDLWVNGHRENARLTFTTRTAYNQNLYNAYGSLDWSAGPVLEATLLLANIQVQPFLRQFKVPLAEEIRGVVSGAVFCTYPFGAPERLELNARLDQTRVDFRHLNIQNQASIFMALEKGRLVLQNTGLKLNGDQLSLRGELEVMPLGQVQAHLNGVLSAELIQPFVPEIMPAGKFDVQCAVRGEAKNPFFSGRIGLKDVSVKVRGADLVFKKINGALDLTSQTVRASRISLESLYGPMILSGDCLLSGFSPHRWNLNLDAERLHLPIPKGFLTQAAANLRLAGTPDSSILSGNIWLERSSLAQKLDLVEFVTLLANFEFTSGEGESLAIAVPVRLNLNIKGDHSIVIETDSIDAIASLDLQVLGTMEKPLVRGILLVNSGEFKFRANRFTLDRGLLQFLNPSVIDPQINMQASADIKDYRVSINLEGPLSRLRTRFTSVPSLPSVDVVQLIATGYINSGSGYRSNSQDRPINPSVLLSQMLSATIQERFTKVIGVDTFSVDTYSENGSADQGAQVSVGKQISKDLYVVYSRSVTDSGQDQFFIEYRLSPRLTVVAAEDRDGYYGIDFRFRKRF